LIDDPFKLPEEPGYLVDTRFQQPSETFNHPKNFALGPSLDDFETDSEDGCDFDEFTDDEDDWDSDEDLANLPVLTLRRANA